MFEHFSIPQDICPNCKSFDIESTYKADENNKITFKCYNCKFQWTEPNPVMVPMIWNK